MRIAVISDTHFGYASGTEREEDAFAQAEAAFDEAIKRQADVILLPGDIFDTRVPKQEVWAKAFKILQKPLLAERSSARLEKTINKDHAHISPITFAGIPVIAIHGTHERRGAHSVNPIEILEKAGFLVHLHCSGVVLDIKGKKLCVQGLSGIPENYVKKVLEAWGPKPVVGCKNIFMFHQSLKEYLYAEGDTFISVNDLPKGFDAYIDGHIHWNNTREGKLFFPGSTVITQQNKIESEKKKSFLMLEINDDTVAYEFIELPQRPFYFKKMEFENAEPKDVVTQARAFIKEVIGKSRKKPLVRVKLCGSLKQGGVIHESDITRDFNALVSVSNEMSSEDFKKKIEELRKLHQEKLSVEEMGMKLIRELLKGTQYTGISPEEIIEALADGNIDYVLKRVDSAFRASSLSQNSAQEQPMPGQPSLASHK